MQTPDDEQFEAYLKRFHPIAPEPVLTVRSVHSSRRSLSLGTSLAAVATFLVAGAIFFHIRSNRVVVPNRAYDIAFVERHAPEGPLTMHSANAWLATAPSFKAAVDGLAFRAQKIPLTQGKRSAVAVLSKEKIRL